MRTQTDVACGKAVEILSVPVKTPRHCVTRQAQHSVRTAHAVRRRVMVEGFGAEVDIKRLGRVMAAITQTIVA